MPVSGLLGDAEWRLQADEEVSVSAHKGSDGDDTASPLYAGASDTDVY